MKLKKLTKLPEADIIIHSGDFTFSGSEEEAFDFKNWFCDLPYHHKIFIAGNHDDCLDWLHSRCERHKKEDEVVFANTVIVDSQYNSAYRARVIEIGR